MGGKCFRANKLPALCWWAVVCLFVSENRGHSEGRRGNHFDQDRQNRDIWGNSWMVQARHPLRRKGKSVSPTKVCAWNHKEKSSLFLVLLYCAICYPVEGQRVWYQEVRQHLVKTWSYYLACCRHRRFWPVCAASASFLFLWFGKHTFFFPVTDSKYPNVTH